MNITFFLKFFSPEFAHSLSIKLLKIKPKPIFKKDIKNIEMLHQRVFGLDFKNPLGLAAGFDKNAEVLKQLLDLGFGFVEGGTATPKPQKGNSKPRLFRLNEDEGIINHLGFNNYGFEIIRKNLNNINLNILRNGIVGINIGKNQSTNNPYEDYLKGLDFLGPLAHYVVINISSPNTPGLRDLQYRGHIEKLAKLLKEKKNDNEKLISTPILLKISPDLNDDELRDIALCSLAMGIDGLIISNSTLNRPKSLKSKYKDEIGGLSGKPIFIDSTILLKKMYSLTNAQLPLIGVGGITNGMECYEKIKSGASLAQIYTSLIYQGPIVVDNIIKQLISCLITDGYKNINEAVGKEV
ncbi:MAG: Dihydroorotate dehydrogenase (quinone) [Alphaproteobacteria bacterium MarineAlpha5_Bin9]|nr:MAG: Dihydroorotate dehydrogenase (quinone) [Alphaproteobacteria bacterium MarineAlpha5_Bin9]|tara:strand:- start:32995 stop:34053 length:1059 start_codon:yes stop_codon:yes gene_type:complete